MEHLPPVPDGPAPGAQHAPPAAPPGEWNLLTAEEHRAVALLAEAANAVRAIIGDGPQAPYDWAEAAHHIHALQRMVGSQAAARAYGAVPAARAGRGVAAVTEGVTQTITYDPELEARGVYGNCLQAAVASLLGFPLDAVPHFLAFGERYHDALDLWLAALDPPQRMERHRSAVIPQGRSLVVGPSPRGPFHHVCVGEDGRVVWDPHPSRAGLVQVEQVWLVRRYEAAP